MRKGHKNQNNLKHLTGLTKLKIKNLWCDQSSGVRGRRWQTDTTEPPLLVVNTEKHLIEPIRMKGHHLTPGDSHRSQRNGVGEEAFGSDQSEWIMKRSGQIWHAYLRKREKLKNPKKVGIWREIPDSCQAKKNQLREKTLYQIISLF